MPQDARRLVLPVGVVAIVVVAIIGGWLRLEAAVEHSVAKGVASAMEPQRVLVEQLTIRLERLDDDTDKHAEKPYHAGMPAYVDAKVDRVDDKIDDHRADDH